jgi:hypothetical protein
MAPSYPVRRWKHAPRVGRQLSRCAALRGHRDRSLLLATTLILIAFGGPFWWCQSTLDPAIRASQVPGTGKTVEERAAERLLARADAQHQQHINWAYAALAGIVAVSVVKRVFAIPWLRLAYSLLCGAAAFLLQSIRAGEAYQARVTYLGLMPQMYVCDVKALSGLLWVQTIYLNRAAATLLLFVGVFIVAVMSGRVVIGEQE